MALTRTNRFQETSAETFGTGPFTTGSFTPANNTLLVVRVAADEEIDTGLEGTSLTISDSAGLTWTSRIASTISPLWSYGEHIWTAPITTGVSMTITVDAGAFDVHVYRVEVYEYSDYNTVSPIGGTAAGSDADGDGAATIILSAAPLATSEVLAFAHGTAASGGIQSSPGAGWTEIFDVAITAWSNFQSQSRSGSTSTAVDWADLETAGDSVGAILVALEIRQSVGGVGRTSKLCDQPMLRGPF